MTGMVVVFIFGIRRYRPVANAGKLYPLLETEDPKSEARAKDASWLSKVGLSVLGARFAQQLAALLAH